MSILRFLIGLVVLTCVMFPATVQMCDALCKAAKRALALWI